MLTWVICGMSESWLSWSDSQDLKHCCDSLCCTPSEYHVMAVVFLIRLLKLQFRLDYISRRGRESRQMDRVYVRMCSVPVSLSLSLSLSLSFLWLFGNLACWLMCSCETPTGSCTAWLGNVIIMCHMYVMCVLRVRHAYIIPVYAGVCVCECVCVRVFPPIVV